MSQQQQASIPRSRAACNRCHSQKLRCPKRQGSESCSRCRQSGVECVFGFRTPRSRPTQVPETQQSQANDKTIKSQRAVDRDRGLKSLSNVTFGDDAYFPRHNEVVDSLIDLPMEDPNSWSMKPSDHSGVQNDDFLFLDVESLSEFATVESDPLPPSEVQSVRKLADLNVKLYEHAATLPPKPANPVNLPPVIGKATSSKLETAYNENHAKSQVFAIDTTFLLTQTFMELLLHFYPLPRSRDFFSRSAIVSDTKTTDYLGLIGSELTSQILPCIPDSVQPLQFPSGNDCNTEQSYKSRPLPPDQGTLLLILSCYNRLMDIYEIIFYHARACIEYNVTPTSASGHTFSLPPVQIGSYVPSQSSAFAMRMLLVIQLSSQLFEQMQEVLKESMPLSSEGSGNTPCEEWQGVRDGRYGESPGFTIELIHNMIRKRADVMSENIASTQQLLLTSRAMQQ